LSLPAEAGNVTLKDRSLPAEAAVLFFTLPKWLNRRSQRRSYNRDTFILKSAVEKPKKVLLIFYWVYAEEPFCRVFQNSNTHGDSDDNQNA